MFPHDMQKHWSSSFRSKSIKGVLYDYLMDHMNSDLLNQYYSRNHINPKEVYQPHMVNLPIPQGVLDLLGSNYPQNQGYN